MKKKTFGSYVIIRFFGAYGPYEPERKIYTRLVKRFCLERKRSFTVYGDGRNLIDAMYVDDAVKGILKVIESEASNLTLDFCSENPITINELVYEAARIFGVGMPKLLHEGHTEEYILFHVSGRKMEESFDFRPKVKLNEGLRELAEWLQNRC
jgi:nucleoside-diphosphate-sugar epimerase